MSSRGIDVSRWQGYIDFNAVKRSGIDFVIIKAGGSDAGLYEDPFYRWNYDRAKEAGLNVGAYYFVGPRCFTKEDGKADAERFLRQLQGKKFEYPVYLDWESVPASVREQSTNAAIEFCRTVEDSGYYVGIYASDISGFKERIDITKISDYDLWVASYGREPSYVKSFRSSYGIWQYSSTGNITGISGNVDLDIAYYDFPEIMKKYHLNGF